jgi:hypothetical protein
MGAKGGKECCCDGCHDRPSQNLGTTNLQPMQQRCCACIPRQLCVRVTYPDDSFVNTIIDCGGCNVDASDTKIYCGQVFINGESVLIEIHFTINDDGDCYMCIVSEPLGMDGTIPGDCHGAIDATERAAPTCFCREMAAEWPIYTTSIGDGEHSTATLSTFAADNQSLKRAIDCGGCNCICRCACITVATESGAGTEQTCVEIYNNTAVWITDGGVEIHMVPNAETNCCELELISAGDGISLASSPPNVELGEAALNPCPSPIARWDATDTEGGTVTVIWECVECGECAGTGGGADCCSGSLPRVLTASVDGGIDCDCAVFDLPLIFDDVNGYWEGTNDTAWCDHSITIQFICEADGRFTLSLLNAGPCTNTSQTLYGQDCDPLSAAFSLLVGGIGCCGGVSSSRTIGVTVTE